MEKNRDKEIVKMAIKNFGCGKSYDYEDIFQTGYLGLLLAKQQYKKEKQQIQKIRISQHLQNMRCLSSVVF